MHVDDMSGVAGARRGGVIAAERIGGIADRDLGLACTPETWFQIATVSKHFTAAAVLLLASQSQLSLDDPVSRWFGGCPQDWQVITVHHLLTHTSGLGHLDDFPALDLYQPIEHAQELSIFQQQPLLSTPGSRYQLQQPRMHAARLDRREGGRPAVCQLPGRPYLRPARHAHGQRGRPGRRHGNGGGYHLTCDNLVHTPSAVDVVERWRSWLGRRSAAVMVCGSAWISMVR